ncbi:SMP-30/gluconolactonase/LRE family protein [Acidobacteriota bacterium]
MKKMIGVGIVLFCLGVSLSAQQEIVEFSKDKWYLQGQVVDHLGQKSLRGRAILKDVEFENGVIEVDMAFDGARCFAMIMFRIQQGTSYENFYIRPHKSGQYDALQYQPVYGGLGGWQLYSGEGSTAAAGIAHKRWIHVKLEVKGTQARVFLDHADTPALLIHELRRGPGKGGLGLSGPPNELAQFANFSYRSDDDLDFDLPPPPITHAGMVEDWELSPPLKVTEIDRESHPGRQYLAGIEWKKAAADASGLVDLAPHVRKTGSAPECVMARTFIEAEAAGLRKLTFGYSDEISIFLNGKVLFRGNSEFRRRDPGFHGIVGLHDAVFLPLQEGRNELLLMVTEIFGGWGFTCQLGPLKGEAVHLHDSVEDLWEASSRLAAPESASYDPASDALYVSNFAADYISKLDLEGKVIERKWVAGLERPTGLERVGSHIFAVERRNLVKIDIAAGTVTERFPIPGAVFPNDVAAGGSGELYISDSQRSVIYRFRDGDVEVWLEDHRLPNPNGLAWDGSRLIVGTSGDGSFKAVNPGDKSIITLLRLGSGAVMDGVQALEDGSYLMGDWNGRIFTVMASGEKIELLNTMDAKLTLADFEFIPEKSLLVIPTLNGNRVLAFRVKQP